MGVRSSVLLPLPLLSLVIVDEEHENSFKQADSAPRYHGRDTAVMLAALCGAKTLLGSATPSVESYFNAATGKYGLVTLAERYGGAVLPRVIVSDTLRAAKRGEKRSHFNKVLLDRIGEALQAGAVRRSCSRTGGAFRLTSSAVTAAGPPTAPTATCR